MRNAYLKCHALRRDLDITPCENGESMPWLSTVSWMKRICLLLSALFLLSACDYHEPSQMVFAIGMGVERTDDGEYQVCVEIVSMETGSQETFEPKIAIATGKTMLEATSNVRGLIAQRLDFTHCQLILFDGKVAEAGIRSIVKAILDFKEIDINTLCMVTAGCTPLEVFSTKPLTTRAQSFELRSTFIDELGIEKATRSSSVLWLYDSIGEEKGTSILPRVLITESGGRKVTEFNGSVVLRSGKTAGEFTREEMLFFLIGADSPRHRILSIPYEGGYFSAQMERSESIIEATVVNGQVQVRFAIATEVSYVGDIEPGYTREEIIAMITGYLRAGLERLMDKALYEVDCDLYRIAPMLYYRYPAAMEGVSGWLAYLKDARYTYSITIDLQTDERLGVTEGGNW